jgi:AMMECR1 domain-containing protein
MPNESAIPMTSPVERISGPSTRSEFLNNLCYKMGADPHLWQRKDLDVFVYQVEEFHESTNA